MRESKIEISDSLLTTSHFNSTYKVKKSINAKNKRFDSSSKNLSSIDLLNKIRSKKPLVHHITNWVSVYDCVNMTLAFGAFPVITNTQEDVDDVNNSSSSLVFNLGTSTPKLVERMIVAGKKANQFERPIILDIIGVLIDKSIIKFAIKILNSCKVDIIKGNYAEIKALADSNSKIKAAKSDTLPNNINFLVVSVAKRWKCTVVATGKEDIIADSKRLFVVKNGHKKMERIIGVGCMASSVIASFAAVCNDYVIASKSALASYCIAAELAAEKSYGSTSFKKMFFDEAYNLDETKLLLENSVKIN